MSAKRKGREIRIVTSIRLEPSKKQMLKKKYGSVQAAIDWLVTLLASGKKNI